MDITREIRSKILRCVPNFLTEGKVEPETKAPADGTACVATGVTINVPMRVPFDVVTNLGHPWALVSRDVVVKEPDAVADRVSDWDTGLGVPKHAGLLLGNNARDTVPEGPRELTFEGPSTSLTVIYVQDGKVALTAFLITAVSEGKEPGSGPADIARVIF